MALSPVLEALGPQGGRGAGELAPCLEAMGNGCPVLGSPVCTLSLVFLPLEEVTAGWISINSMNLIFSLL